MKTIDWQNTIARSADGTAISVLSLGTGPGLVVIPGYNRRAHHYEALARAVGDAYPVHVLDRRGRGLSGPQGPHYSVEAEAADVSAVLTHTGSDLVFGHSYGGLVGLHLALWRSIAGLVVYEPAVSIGGSFNGGWFPEFRRLLAAGRHGAAMASFLKGTRLVPIGDPPIAVFRALAFLVLHGTEGAETKAMMGTAPAELAEVFTLNSNGRRYAAIRTPTLLLGGARTPDYLTGVLPRLAQLIPGARHEILPDLDHFAPNLNAPETVAEKILGFVDGKTRVG
jgi:pimeloyl-ACP methyl ester carboxylesterase